MRDNLIRDRMELRLAVLEAMADYVQGPPNPGVGSPSMIMLAKLFCCEDYTDLIARHKAEESGEITRAMEAILDHGLPMFLLLWHSKVLC